MDVDDLPADGPRPPRCLAGRRHRARGGRRRGQGTRSPARRRRDDRARRGLAAVALGRRPSVLARLPRPARAARASRPGAPARSTADSRRTIAACIGVDVLSSQPDLPSHVQRIVDEIENEIGDEPNRPAATIEGSGSDGGHGANGRVEAAVHEILDRDRRGSRSPGPDRDARPRPPDVHRADRRLPRRSGAAHQRRDLRHRLQRDGRRQGHPVLLAVRAPPAAVLRDRGGRATSRAAGSSGCRRSRASSRCTRAGSRSRSG